MLIIDVARVVNPRGLSRVTPHSSVPVQTEHSPNPRWRAISNKVFQNGDELKIQV